MPSRPDPAGDIIHLAICVERLSSCHQTLRDVQANPGHPLVRPAFRYAVVEYMTLFTKSQDAQRHFRSVPTTCVPAKHTALHERLKTERHKVHAHMDMSLLDGSLYFVGKAGLPTAALTHVDELAELKNIEEFLDLIQGVRDNLFADYRTQLTALPRVLP